MTWQRFPSRIITPLVDKVIVVSQEQKQKLNNNKTVVIPCGIDTGLFQPMPRAEARIKLNLPPDKKLVMWVGEATRPEKRLDIAEAAIDLAREKDPAIELVKVSRQPRQMMPVYMNACDVLLLVSDGEGSPMVIKEAMACNLPIVSTAVGDVPEVIGGTRGCFLCTQEPADVAEKIHLALNNRERTNGRGKINYLQQGETAKKILAIYEEVLHKKKHLPAMSFKLSKGKNDR
jgi:glycosyltransferase involved in cell wall biosynthesis